MSATASWCCRTSCRPPTATPCRHARPSWWRASIRGRRARSSRPATRAMRATAISSSRAAPSASSSRRRRRTQLNKIGHALHDLDPVFDRVSRQPKLAALAHELGLAAAAAAAVDVHLQAARHRRRGRLASGRDLPAHDAGQRHRLLDRARRCRSRQWLPAARCRARIAAPCASASAGRAMRWSPTSSMRRRGRPSSRCPSRSGAARWSCCTACCRMPAAPTARLGRAMPIRCI